MPQPRTRALAATGTLLLVTWALSWLAGAGPGPAPPPEEPAPIATRTEEATAAIVTDPPRAAAQHLARTLAETGPTQPAACNLEWLLLPRSDRDVVLAILSAPQNTSARLLLRNSAFNPRDLPLPRAAREAVAAAIGASRSTCEARAATRAAVHEREFAELHAAGHTTEVDLSRFEGGPQMALVGSNPTFRVIDGRTFGASRERMPRTRQSEREIHEVGAGLVARLADVFAEWGAITAEERQTLLTRATAPSAPEGRRRAGGR